MPKTTNPLTELRKLIGKLPGTSETLSHGSPTFWANKKTFATFHSGGYDEGRPAAWIKAPPGAQEAMIAADPERFYRPKYLGPSGWVAMRLVGNVDWAEVASLLAQGHALVAPKRAVAVSKPSKSNLDPVFKKLQLGDQPALLVVGAPASFDAALASVSPRTVATTFRKKTPFSFVLVFVRSCAEIEANATKAVSRLGHDAALWFAYPKKSSKNYKSDIGRDDSWQPLGDLGFEAVRQIAIDADWSALRFRRVEQIKKLIRNKSRAMTTKGRARTR